MKNTFAERLKNLRKKHDYTQKDLSEVLGIKQTTISNYEKGLRFPDADKLKQISNLFNVTVDYLLGDNNKIENIDKYNVVADENEFKKLLEYLLKGYKNNARELILDMYKLGVDIEWIYFNILEKALKEVGVLWEAGIIDVWNEHYVSENILDIMRELKSYENENKDKKVSIICLTAGAEQHNIGIKMISDILEIEGYNSIYLGSNVPTLSIINAIKIENPKFIAISVTISNNIESAKNIISSIKSTFKNKAPLIIIGGIAFINTNDVCKDTEADFYCTNIEDIKNIVAK